MKNKKQALILADVLEKLERMISGTGISPEAAASGSQRRYLETWVIPNLETSIKHILGAGDKYDFRDAAMHCERNLNARVRLTRVYGEIADVEKKAV